MNFAQVVIKSRWMMVTGDGDDDLQPVFFFGKCKVD